MPALFVAFVDRDDGESMGDIETIAVDANLHPNPAESAIVVRMGWRSTGPEYSLRAGETP